MENQSLILTANSYIQLAKSLSNTLEQKDDLNILLSKLPDIRLDENYVLDDFRPRDLTNSVLWLYARQKSLARPKDTDFQHQGRNFWYALGFSKNKCRSWAALKIGGITLLKYRKTIEPENPFKYISVPFTEAGIWQAYLLERTYHLIGMRWHGGYAKRTFINAYEDISEICVYKKEAIREIREKIGERWTPDLSPSVVLDGDYAYITHCWFDEWKGLVQMKWKVMYDKSTKHIAKFHLEDEKVLVKYSCGIRY